jgi:hydroxymethylbilane synthase
MKTSGMKVKIGTRGSKLALWQAYHVEGLLREAGFDTEIVTIETKGDKILDVSIAKIGSKGVFTEEIEEQLAHGHIDIAVHSAKDMQSTLPEGFDLIAFMEREEAQDVIISDQSSANLTNEELLLGTSSTRRVATLKSKYPHVKTVPVRGNLQTRIRKMKEGACDALHLAYAGVHRMGYEHLIVEKLSLNEFIPAVGQGSIAIEVHQTIDHAKKEKIREVLNHHETELCLKAERSFLRTMDGGCSIPVYGHAILKEDQIEMEAGIISLDGSREVRRKKSISKDNPLQLGFELASEILTSGGKSILEEIKKEIDEK